MLSLNFSNEETNSSLSFETYFKPISLTYLSESESLALNASAFLTSLTKIQLSSNYDAKERRLNDYASILDTKTNPSILMKFDPINETLEFTILWTNPNGNKCFKIIPGNKATPA